MAQAELWRRGEIVHERVIWLSVPPPKMWKLVVFHPNIFAGGTCRTSDGTSQVMDWSSQVLEGYILVLRLTLLHLIRALWSHQNMYFHWMLAIKRCSQSQSDWNWDPRIGEGGKILPLSKPAPLLRIEQLSTCKSRKWIVPNALYSHQLQSTGLRSA